jgi:hypothetical protein
MLIFALEEILQIAHFFPNLKNKDSVFLWGYV